MTGRKTIVGMPVRAVLAAHMPSAGRLDIPQGVRAADECHTPAGRRGALAFGRWLRVSGPVSVRWSPFLPTPVSAVVRSAAVSDCWRRVRTICEQPLILNQWTHALASSDLARPLEQRKRRNGERTGSHAD
jgi:hypothetical protein